MNGFSLLLNNNPIIKRQLNIQTIRHKYKFILKNEALDYFENGNKHRKHPGKRGDFQKTLPFKLKFSAETVLKRYRNKNFRRNVAKIKEEFHKVFIEDPEKEQQLDKSISKIKVDENYDYKTFNREKEKFLSNQKQKFEYFKKDLYNDHDCAGYMAVRLAPNHAALSYVFNEILKEEPGFVPSSVFDFGSGVGTTIWTADQYWGNSIREYFCVDLNECMNELSRELLRNGTENNENISNQIFYRRFLPAKHLPSYDLVVSAFSLLEMEDTRQRIYTIENLWQKTAGLLVLIEHGSKAGFAAIMEARNFLLQINRNQAPDPESMEPNRDSSQVSRRLQSVNGSILAPCPHDLICPRHSELQTKSYCNFSVNYLQLDYGQSDPGARSEKFTFLVMKKYGHFNWNEEQKNWAKVVQPVIKNPRHIICRVCDNDGQLKEIISSKSKCSMHLYRCVRNCKWGDKIPADIIFEPKEKSIKEIESKKYSDSSEE